MQGLGCLIVIIMGIIWFALAKFLGFGMPVIGLLAACLLWRPSPAFSGILAVISVAALCVAYPIMTTESYGTISDWVFHLLALLQGVITAMLLSYTLVGEARHSPEASSGFCVAWLGGWAGLTANAYVFGFALVL